MHHYTKLKYQNTCRLYRIGTFSWDSLSTTAVSELCTAVQRELYSVVIKWLVDEDIGSFGFCWDFGFTAVLN